MALRIVIVTLLGTRMPVAGSSGEFTKLGVFRVRA